MHPSARAHMALCIKTYLKQSDQYRVVDFGSRISPNQEATHRDLFADYDISYVGVDVQPGRNVDVVMEQPYRIPLRSNSVDVVVSGQVLEHVPFFWVSVSEIARILRPGGHFFLTVPSRGNVHDTYDCWRFHPDGMRAIAAHTRMKLVEAHTDFPPKQGSRVDYAGIDAANYYWGDTVGVFRKVRGFPHPWRWAAHQTSMRWANHMGGLEAVPVPRARKSRQDVLQTKGKKAATTAARTPAPAAKPAAPQFPVDFDDEAVATIKRVKPYTMCSPEKLIGFIHATRYVAQHKIPGDIVECGVWRGGSMQAAALTLLEAGDVTRDLYLYDTFEGMPPPTDEDKRLRDGASAAALMQNADVNSPVRAYATLDVVKQGFAGVEYPAEKVHYVVGKVEDTIPGTVPEQIAILRLDTDWYTSTLHELDHLYPRLVSGGVLILDDYGHWAGAKQAVHEWLDRTGERLLLLRMAEGRIAIKP